MRDNRAMLNKVTLIGRLGADPEIRYTANGDAVANISVATHFKWKDKQTGEKKEATEWHRVVFFNRLAEVAGEYLKKGAQVYVEGRLKTSKWQDTHGQDRYTTEIIATEMKMLDSRSGGTGQFESTPSTKVEPNLSKTDLPPAPPPQTYDDFDDDIPF